VRPGAKCFWEVTETKLIGICFCARRVLGAARVSNAQTIADVLGEEGFARSLSKTDLEDLFAEA